MKENIKMVGTMEKVYHYLISKITNSYVIKKSSKMVY